MYCICANGVNKYFNTRITFTARCHLAGKPKRIARTRPKGEFPRDGRHKLLLYNIVEVVPCAGKIFVHENPELAPSTPCPSISLLLWISETTQNAKVVRRIERQRSNATRLVRMNRVKGGYSEQSQYFLNAPFRCKMDWNDLLHYKQQREPLD